MKYLNYVDDENDQHCCPLQMNGIAVVGNDYEYNCYYFAIVDSVDYVVDDDVNENELKQ